MLKSKAISLQQDVAYFFSLPINRFIVFTGCLVSLGSVYQWEKLDDFENFSNFYQKKCPPVTEKSFEISQNFCSLDDAYLENTGPSSALFREENFYYSHDSNHDSNVLSEEIFPKDVLNTASLEKKIKAFSHKIPSKVARPSLPSVHGPSFVRIQGVVTKNLFQDLLRRGVSSRLAYGIIRSLSAMGLNWRSHLKPGDRFSFLCQKSTVRSKESFDGLLLVKIVLKDGRRYVAFRYRTPDQKSLFYNDAGLCYGSQRFRKPVDRGKLRDGFGMRRHPIFGCLKMHKGVDWAAPRGTPVRAAWEGVVEKVGWYGGYGKYVRIRHLSGYCTAYAHLDQYAKSLKKGQKVQQGQLIGFVGSTGYTTGPHLHFEVLRGKQQINPLKVASLLGGRLIGSQQKKFRLYMKKILDIYNNTAP